MDEVRATSAWVASQSSHVTIDPAGIEKVAETMKDSIPKVEWDFEGIHYFDNGPLTVQYLFVLDALNFCFWPDKELSYDHLAAGLKEALQNNKSAFDADRLQKYTGPELRKMLKWPRPLPLEDERVRLLHEVGFELERSFEGKASKLVESCQKSAAKLVALISQHFPGFRDHTVYKGHQVFLYKRAQIFAADLWGSFKGQQYGEFNDIESVTMFADYIVPAVLQQLGVLKFSTALSHAIMANVEIHSGSEEEVELRACSVHAVEEIRESIHRKSGKQVNFFDRHSTFFTSFSYTMASLIKHIGGLECRVGSLVVGIWDPMFSSTSSNTLYILLSGPYDLSRLNADFSLGFQVMSSEQW